MLDLPLEDSFGDILGKAARGLALSREQVAAKAHAEPEAVKALFGGTLEEALLQKVAPVLQLAPGPLVALARGEYQPAGVNLDGLAQFNTPFEDMTVNAYLAWDPASKEAVIFDTGADASELLEFVQINGLQVKLVLITHTHGDHIFELDRVRSRTGAPAFVGDREPIDGAESFPAGRTFTCGALQIESRLTWGHSQGGITYVVRGLAQPVAVVGDAVFAGSMGGGAVSFADAMETNRKEIFSLPLETIICPGHGPLTTVGEESQHNPFYAVAGK